MLWKYGSKSINFQLLEKKYDECNRIKAFVVGSWENWIQNMIIEKDFWELEVVWQMHSFRMTGNFPSFCRRTVIWLNSLLPMFMPRHFMAMCSWCCNTCDRIIGFWVQDKWCDSSSRIVAKFASNGQALNRNNKRLRYHVHGFNCHHVSLTLELISQVQFTLRTKAMLQCSFAYLRKLFTWKLRKIYRRKNS